jgi:hypothetical protein
MKGQLLVTIIAVCGRRHVVVKNAVDLTDAGLRDPVETGVARDCRVAKFHRYPMSQIALIAEIQTFGRSLVDYVLIGNAGDAGGEAVLIGAVTVVSERSGCARFIFRLQTLFKARTNAGQFYVVDIALPVAAQITNRTEAQLGDGQSDVCGGEVDDGHTVAIGEHRGGGDERYERFSVRVAAAAGRSGCRTGPAAHHSGATTAADAAPAATAPARGQRDQRGDQHQA